MFIREITKKNPNSPKIFTYHRLVEAIRVQDKARQRVVLELGTLDLPRERWKDLANRIEELLNGRGPRLLPLSEEIELLAVTYAQRIRRKQRKDQESVIQPTEQSFLSVDINSIETEKPRSIGAEHAGLAAVEALGFGDIFKQLDFSKTETDLAKLLIVGRLVHPSSERELKSYAQEHSAIDLLLGTDFSHIGQNALYRTSDLLLTHKDALEDFLRIRTKKMLSLSETILLYDLTNTYFEGAVAQSTKTARGWSKEQRYDRPLMTLGLVLDEHGFVKCSRILAGNVSEAKTLLDAVAALRQDAGQTTLPVAKPTIVIDAGIATEENCAALKQAGFSYLAVSRKKPDAFEKEPLEEIKQGVFVRSFQQGDEVFVYCRSEGKNVKEEGIVAKMREKMEAALTALSVGIEQRNKLKKYDKIMERIGRLRERHGRVSKGYDITVKEQDGLAIEIIWTFDASKLSKPYDGSYFLRTDRTDLAAGQLWSLYTMLTLVEDSFRCLKSELGLRPIHHRKEERIDAHIFISVLAYHLLSYIQYRCKRSGLQHRWPTLRQELCSHSLVVTTLTKQGGGSVSMRYCTTPGATEKAVYSALGITATPLKKTKAHQQM